MQGDNVNYAVGDNDCTCCCCRLHLFCCSYRICCCTRMAFLSSSCALLSGAQAPSVQLDPAGVTLTRSRVLVLDEALRKRR